jgi:hypothetical protein
MIQKRMFYLIEISQMRNKIAVHAWKKTKNREKRSCATHKTTKTAFAVT